MISLREFTQTLQAALDAIDEAKGAEDRRKIAEQAMERARALRQDMLSEGARAKGEANAHVESQKKAAADLQASMERQLAAHEGQMVRLKQTSSDQLAELDRTIAERTAEIRRLNGERDAINAEVAQLKANLAETLKKYG